MKNSYPANSYARGAVQKENLPLRVLLEMARTMEEYESDIYSIRSEHWLTPVLPCLSPVSADSVPVKTVVRGTEVEYAVELKS